MGVSFAAWLVSIPENRFLDEIERVRPWEWLEAQLKEHIPHLGRRGTSWLRLCPVVSDELDSVVVWPG